MHQNAVAEVDHLVEVERDEEDAAALVALGDELLVDELDRADVETAGRLHGQERVRLAVQLAGDDQLLLIAAGERARPACPESGRARRTRASAARSGSRLPG